MDYTKYGPYICIGVVLVVIFILWAFFGGKNYEFVGLEPLKPEFTGTNNICMYNENDNITLGSPVVVDNTPKIPDDIYQSNYSNSIEGLETICLYDDMEAEIIRNEMGGIAKLKGKEAKGKYSSKGERMCCQVMEKIYGVPFKKVKPSWLKNVETGKNLELDCYNDELKIAVEYNGEQHYKFPNYFHKEYDDFINQLRRDRLKSDLCAHNGIYLIIVPYNIPHNKIFDYILSK